MTDKIENTKEVLTYCSTSLSIAAFIKIVAIFFQLQILSIICCNICSFILIQTVHLSTKPAISHSTSKIVNMLTIGKSKKLLIVINTDSLRKSNTVNIGDAVNS